MTTTATDRAATLPRSSRPATGQRSDIQGLRAVAVTLVLLFHLWPARMTGGYVGVDVFFVISGFLITSHLLRSPPRTLRDVGHFWGRRVRRLLPAAFVVIVATMVATWALLPESQWRALARDAIASAFYVENWNLAANATDYLAAEGSASPFQQFWSLSVEEQFYIVWPLLITAALAVAARRAAATTTAVAVVVAGVFVASLAASLLLTASNPAEAYFVTHTRMWELALGGLLAVAAVSRPGWLAWPDPVRALVAWLSLGAIAWSAFTFTAATPFPGAAGLVPTVAAAAFIAARSEAGAWSPGPVMRTTPVQYVGDVSYSVYLWHWPIIVVLPYLTGQSLTWPVKLGIAAAVLVIAGFSKAWVEDPPQRIRGLATPSGAARLATAGMAAVLVLGVGQTVVAQTREASAAADLAAVLEGGQVCIGAAVMAPGADCEGGPHGAELLTSPAQAATDKPDAYADKCWTTKPFNTPRTCTFGRADDPTARIALVGNSHAGHWLPTLQKIAEDRGWQITTFLASECFLVEPLQDFALEGASEGCRDWGRWALEGTTGRGFDLIVTSARSGPSLTGVEPDDQVSSATEAYLATLGSWADAGDRVLVLRDTPYGEVVTPDCIAENEPDLFACDGPRSRREVPDPMADAARAMGDPDVKVADLTRFFCDEDTCHSTVGGLIVYFDRSHMTTAFARSLAPFLEPHTLELLAAPA